MMSLEITFDDNQKPRSVHLNDQMASDRRIWHVLADNEDVDLGTKVELDWFVLLFVLGKLNNNAIRVGKAEGDVDALFVKLNSYHRNTCRAKNYPLKKLFRNRVNDVDAEGWRFDKIIMNRRRQTPHETVEIMGHFLENNVSIKSNGQPATIFEIEKWCIELTKRWLADNNSDKKPTQQITEWRNKAHNLPNPQPAKRHSRPHPAQFGTVVITDLRRSFSSEEPLRDKDATKRFIDSRIVETFSAWKQHFSPTIDNKPEIDYIHLTVRVGEEFIVSYPKHNDRTSMFNTVKRLENHPTVLNRDKTEQPFLRLLEDIPAFWAGDRFVLVLKKDGNKQAAEALDFLGPTIYVNVSETILDWSTKKVVKFKAENGDPKALEALKKCIEIVKPACWHQSSCGNIDLPSYNDVLPKMQMLFEEYLHGQFIGDVAKALLNGMGFFSLNNLYIDSKNDNDRYIFYSVVRSGDEVVGGVVLYSSNRFDDGDVCTLADAYRLFLHHFHKLNRRQ